MTPEEYAKFVCTLYKRLRSERMDIPRYGFLSFGHDDAVELTKVIVREVAHQKGSVSA